MIWRSGGREAQGDVSAALYSLASPRFAEGGACTCGSGTLRIWSRRTSTYPTSTTRHPLRSVLVSLNMTGIQSTPHSAEHCRPSALKQPPIWRLKTHRAARSWQVSGKFLSAFSERPDVDTIVRSIGPKRGLGNCRGNRDRTWHHRHQRDVDHPRIVSLHAHCKSLPAIRNPHTLR